MKRTFITILSAIAVMAGLLSCEPAETPGKARTLDAPANLRFEVQDDLTFIISWDAVEDAVSYTVLFNNEEEIVEETTFVKTVERLAQYNVRVRANGDNKMLFDSDWSTITVGQTPEILDVPQPRIESKVDGNTVTISWDPIEHASGYHYTFTPANSVPVEAEISDTKVVFEDLAVGQYTFEMYAVAEDIYYRDSRSSDALTVVIIDQRWIGSWDFTSERTLEFSLDEEDPSIIYDVFVDEPFSGTIRIEEDPSGTGNLLVYGLSTVYPRAATRAAMDDEFNLMIYGGIGVQIEGDDSNDSRMWIPYASTTEEGVNTFISMSSGSQAVIELTMIGGQDNAVSTLASGTLGDGRGFTVETLEIFGINSNTGHYYLLYEESAYPVRLWAGLMQLTRVAE